MLTSPDDTLPDSPEENKAPAPLFKWPFLAAMFCVAIGLFALGSFIPSRSSKSQLIVPPAGKVAAANQTSIKVHVIGEVNTPGLYECRPNERIQDAITRAGGATPNANVNAINLSAFLEDGQQINVPSIAAATSEKTPSLPKTASNPPQATGAPLNLNTATREQLEALPGIGPATANNILALRQQKKRFQSVEELDEVPGIGAKKLEKLRPLLTVS